MSKFFLGSPFNEAKFEALLKGLSSIECIVIKKSEAFDPFYKARIDAEFFQKHLRDIHKKVSSLNSDLISNLAFVSDGEHGNAITSTTGYSKYYGARHVLTGILNDKDVEFITKEHHDKLRKTELRPRDVLISCVGANIGHASIVPDDVGIANIVRNVALIRSTSAILNEYLLAYFLSSYGKTLYIRMNTGNAQPLVSLDYIKTIPVFIASKDFQTVIKKLVTNALQSFENTKKIYNDASNFLLSELKFSGWIPSEENKAIKTLSQSFALSGRLDAEYYQPKYDSLMEKITSSNHLLLKNLVSFKKSIEPGSDAYQSEGIPFIRVADVSKLGMLEPEHHLNREYFDLDEYKPKKDTILFSKDGTVGIAFKVEENLDVITSSALLHLKIISKEVLPDYLTLVLNSMIVQMQAERDAGGSIIQHWRPDEIKQVAIPILPNPIQKAISEQVQKSFAFRKESAQLLAIAKQAVEVSIEKSEADAIKFINSSTNSL